MGIPSVGTIIDRYQVKGVIGAGSMGDVVEGIDTDLQRKVAIKILSEKHRDDKELEARFVREGRAVAAISHANVVQVFTTGIYDGRPYIAMEFLTGSDLGSFVATRGPLSSVHAAKAILDSAKGLEAAAHAGLIHRDVKPANLVMLDSGTVKVTDFGLAKPIEASNQPALTALGVVVGTPDYIAPEQARGDEIDERVDLYALGGTLYFLLIGTPPFRKGNPVDDKYLKVVARHLNEPAPNPLLINPAIDGQLARLQLRLMSKKASARPGYPELIAELSEIIQRLEEQDAGTAVGSMAVNTPSAALSCPTPYLGGNRSANKAVPTSDSEQTTALPASRSKAIAPDEEPLLAKRSRGFAIVTSLSAIFLAAALLLYFFGPLPSTDTAKAEAPTAAIDGGVVAKARPPVADATPPLVVPVGMLLIPADGERGAFFISTSPVRYQDYSELFPNQKKPTKNKKRQDAPVTQLSFSNAQSYARTKGKALPSKEQWLAALSVRDFQSRLGLWEWIDSKNNSKTRHGSRAVINKKGKTAKRKSRPYKDVGFRLVQPLP